MSTCLASKCQALCYIPIPHTGTHAHTHTYTHKAGKMGRKNNTNKNI
jgi:hypothetical protein